MDAIAIIIATIVTCIVIAVGILLQARAAERSQRCAANDNPWDVTAITIAILGPGLLVADIAGVIWLGSIWS